MRALAHSATDMDAALEGYSLADIDHGLTIERGNNSMQEGEAGVVRRLTPLRVRREI
jgi:hypothetical protein